MYFILQSFFYIQNQHQNSICSVLYIKLKFDHRYVITTVTTWNIKFDFFPFNANISTEIHNMNNQNWYLISETVLCSLFSDALCISWIYALAIIDCHNYLKTFRIKKLLNRRIGFMKSAVTIELIQLITRHKLFCTHWFVQSGVTVNKARQWLHNFHYSCQQGVSI